MTCDNRLVDALFFQDELSTDIITSSFVDETTGVSHHHHARPKTLLLLPLSAVSAAVTTTTSVGYCWLVVIIRYTDVTITNIRLGALSLFALVT